MSCDTDRDIPLSVAMEYARKAHDKGKAAGREEVLKANRYAADLNGHFLSSLKPVRKGDDPEKSAWISAKIKKLIGEGKPQDQAAAIAYSMWRRRKLKAFIERVVRKAAAFVESEHPRDTHGQFIPKGDIDSARGNPTAEAALRARVRPEDAAILEEHLAHPGEPDSTLRTARTGVVRSQRGIGEDRGEDVRSWLSAVTAAIRHGADYDHNDIASAITRATTGTVPKLRRVLRALDPTTLISDQPTSKEGVQRRIREIISTAVHAAKDDRLHREVGEREKRDQELHRHAVSYALKLRDAVGHLERMEGWKQTEPASTQAGDAVHQARELIARLLGHEESLAKALPVEPSADPAPSPG